MWRARRVCLWHARGVYSWMCACKRSVVVAMQSFDLAYVEPECDGVRLRVALRLDEPVVCAGRRGRSGGGMAKSVNSAHKQPRVHAAHALVSLVFPLALHGLSQGARFTFFDRCEFQFSGSRTHAHTRAHNLHPRMSLLHRIMQEQAPHRRGRRMHRGASVAAHYVLICCRECKREEHLQLQDFYSSHSR
jgi:hypothetical protein